MCGEIAKIYSQHILSIQLHIMNYSYYAVYQMLRTYSSCNWKILSFDLHLPISPKLVATSFTIAKIIWKQLKCPCVHQWIKILYIWYYSAIKRNKYCHLQQHVDHTYTSDTLYLGFRITLYILLLASSEYTPINKFCNNLNQTSTRIHQCIQDFSYPIWPLISSLEHVRLCVWLHIWTC